MVGVVVISVVLVLLLPIGFLFLGAAVSAIASWSLTAHGESSHEGSELIELNR